MGVLWGQDLELGEGVTQREDEDEDGEEESLSAVEEWGSVVDRYRAAALMSC